MSDYKTFTSQDLMKAIGLQVGDRVKIKFEVSNIIDVTITTEERILNIVYDNHLGVGLEHNGVIVPIERILNRGFKILPKPKRVGENICNGNCPTCPCIFVCNEEVNAVNKTLYEVLDEGIKTFKNLNGSLQNQVYNAIKEQLDKEVEEHESNTN